MMQSPDPDEISGPDLEQDLLLATKLLIPKTRLQFVKRNLLLNKFDQGLRTRFTLVSAPPGFGKTTSVSLWLSTLTDRQIYAAWFSLDEGDNDPVRFLTYLLTTMINMDIEVGSNSLDLLRSGQASSVRTVLQYLINEIIASPERMVIVIDDYHEIEETAIHEGLAFLIDNMPPNMHLVMITRIDPPISIARLRARGQLTEIQAVDLKFSLEEITEYLNTVKSLELSENDISKLESKTEGWIAGLQMAALSLEGSADKSGSIATFSGEDRFILDYLVEEVLNQQTQEIQSFLLETSVLNRLTAPLCNSVIGREDSSEMLKLIESANLFLVPLDNKRIWYRYDPLFAQFLRARLESTQAEKILELHHKASLWFEENGFISEAIDHAISALDYERATLFIEQISDSAWMIVGSAKVLEWVEALPDEIVRSHPRIYLLKAWMLLASGQFEEVELHLLDADDLISRAYENMDDAEHDTLLTDLATLRANVACYRGDLQLSIQLLGEALEHLTEEVNSQRNLIATNIAFYLHDKSDPRDRIAEATRLLAQATTAGDLFTGLQSNNGLAVLLYKAGRLYEAESTFNKTLQFSKSKFELDDQSLASLLAFAFMGLGDIRREWNDLELALHYTLESIKNAEKAKDGIALLNAYLILARVKMARGETESAFEIQREAEKAWRKIASTPDMEWIITQGTGYTARLYLTQGKFDRASRWARESGLATHKEFDLRVVNSYITLARVRIAEGKSENAVELLTWLETNLEQLGMVSSLIEVLILQARAFEGLGQNEKALERLEQALTTAEPGNYIRLFLDEGEAIERMLKIASAKGIKPHYVEKLLNEFGAQVRPTPASTQELLEPLSEHELRVLRLISAGLTNREISQELVVSVNTVKWHVKNIYSKLGVHNRTQASARAAELGLLKR
jgi:LuxR family maltose regulon positive regulatory protein